MRFPTQRGVFLVALGLPLGFAAMVLSQNWWLFSILWLLGSVAALLADTIMTPLRSAVTLSAENPSILYVGETDDMRVDLEMNTRQKSVRAAVALQFSGEIKPVEPQNFRFVQGAAGLSVPLAAVRRGAVALQNFTLRWQGPLGLMASQYKYDVPFAAAVVPNTRVVGRESAKLQFEDALLGLKQQRRKGQGTEFEALREFGQGSDRRHIDWKHSARHGKLLVKEFDTERNHNIMFAFDSGQLMSEPLGDLTRLDRAINAGLMLAQICVRFGDKIGLYEFDAAIRQYIEPSGGQRAFTVFAAHTGQVAQRAQEANFTLALTELAQKMQRRSLIVIFSEFIDSTTAHLMVENIGRLAKKHLVLFVTFADQDVNAIRELEPTSAHDVARVVVAEELHKERRIVLEKIRRAGVLVLETKPEHLTFNLIDRYLDIKARELI